MDSNDVFSRNMKTKEEVEVQNPQDLMVGLKKEKEEVKKVIEDVENFDSYEEITEQTKEDLKKRDITTLFPIQSACFKDIYENNDVIARDLTGSGKTLAFCLPLVERYRELGYFKASKSYVRNLFAIILTPTRELAIQVADELKKLQHKEHEYKVLTVYGGVPIESQTKELRYGVEFFVGTCGRVLDHIERGNIDFSNLKTVVLDEADQMLNMGFQEDIETIMSKVNGEVKEKPQFLLFSATIPDWLKGVAKQYLTKDYKTIDLVKNLKNKTASNVKHLALSCPYQNKISVLADVLRCYGGLKGKSIVFVQTKVEANSIILSEKMRNNAEVLHGDIAQNQREVTLKRFREGKFNVLVATDVASRGLDIPNVDLVIQLEPPKEIESYIHRSGRTARAGKEGICITFYSGREYNTIQEIEYAAGIRFKKITPPRNEDIIKVAAADVVENLKQVDSKILPLFEDAADSFIKEVGAREALCMALAFISETSKEHLSSRSYLTGEDGVITYILKPEREIRNVSYAYTVIQRTFSEGVASKIKGVKMLRNLAGVAFDIPEAAAEELDREFKEESCSKRGMPFTLERASDAPELESDGYNKSGGGGGGYNKKYQGGFQTQRYHKSDYQGHSDSYNDYQKPYKQNVRNAGYKEFSGKTDDRYDAKPKVAEKSDADAKSVSGISFGGKPTFFSRNKTTTDNGEKSQPDKSNFSRGDFGNNDGAKRGDRGGFRGRGRGRGGF